MSVTITKNLDGSITVSADDAGEAAKAMREIDGPTQTEPTLSPKERFGRWVVPNNACIRGFDKLGTTDNK